MFLLRIIFVQWKLLKDFIRKYIYIHFMSLVLYMYKIYIIFILLQSSCFT